MLQTLNVKGDFQENIEKEIFLGKKLCGVSKEESEEKGKKKKRKMIQTREQKVSRL